MDLYQQFIYKSRYARWLEKEGRREDWRETVDRYAKFFLPRVPYFLRQEFFQAIDLIFHQEIMPSMRCLMTAGPALERDHASGYNCYYRAIQEPYHFAEIMYVLMCGAGAGFSVERQFICNLPEIAEDFIEPNNVVLYIRDSKRGWCEGFISLLELLYSGQIPTWDLSRLRPAGSRLKIFGGRSSGPETLDDLYLFTVNLFKKAKGRKLNSVECHDLLCKIAETVVVGGVRRSAMISLSNLTDERMRNAKSGEWYEIHPQRSYANNSVCYTEKPDIGIFLREWSSLYESHAGERGIFNRIAAQRKAAQSGRRDSGYAFGTNPCGEVILRDGQFCNLTEVIIRPNDSLDYLVLKVRAATLLGTLQSTLTDFRFMLEDVKKNCDEERLLGVSLTGIMDHDLFNNLKTRGYIVQYLHQMKQGVYETNAKWADALKIPRTASATTIKPSGTVSQLVNSSSGIHTRFSPYYIRRVMADSKDPLAQFIKAAGIPCEEKYKCPNQWVFSFPIKSPGGSIFVKDMTAIQQLEHCKIFADEWCDHNPSMTVYYKEEEFLACGAWVYEHFNESVGVAFLPVSDHIYKQAPYEAITSEEYTLRRADMPSEIDWIALAKYEKEDNTIGSHELACSGDHCEIVDLI